MSGKGPKKRRGRPLKLRVRPIVDKLACTPGFDHLLIGKGKRGEGQDVGICSPGEFLFRALVEGTANASGMAVSQNEIKRAIRSRRRAEKKPRK